MEQQQHTPDGQIFRIQGDGWKDRAGGAVGHLETGVFAQ